MRLAIAGQRRRTVAIRQPVCTSCQFAEKWAHKLGGLCLVPSIARRACTEVPYRNRPLVASTAAFVAPDVDVDMVVYAYFDGRGRRGARAQYSGKESEDQRTTEVTTGGMYCGNGVPEVRGYTSKLAGGVLRRTAMIRKLPEGASTVTTVARKFLDGRGAKRGECLADPGIDYWGSCQKVGVVEENTTSTTTVISRSGNWCTSRHI